MKEILQKVFITFVLMTSVCISKASTLINGLYYDLNSSAKTATVTYKVLGTSNSSYVSGTLTIPSSVTYNGTTYSVTTIGEEAFYYCTSLTSVSIPATVTQIDKEAFYYCTSLNTLIIQDGTSKINLCYQDWDEDGWFTVSMFSSCPITNLYIGRNIANNTYIDGLDYSYEALSTFKWNSVNVIVGSNVTDINFLYDNKFGINSLNINSTNFTVEENTIYNASKTELDLYYGTSSSFSVPSTVTKIRSNAFYNCDALTSVTIPSSVTSIGNYAFKDCDNLSFITIPSSVTSVGSSIFESCDNLSLAYIQNSTVGVKEFLYCTKLSSVILSSSVTKIDADAFWKCSSLTSIDFPSSLTSIGSCAFGNCGLTSLTIPSTVTSIGEEAFCTNTSLESVNINNSTISNLEFFGCTNLSTVNLSDNIRSIGYAAFVYEYYGGEDYICYCPKINVPSLSTWLKVTQSYDQWYVGGTCTSNVGKLYIDNVLLTSVDIPDTITSINTYAFYGLTDIKTVSYSTSIKSCGTECFPSSVTTANVRVNVASDNNIPVTYLPSSVDFHYFADGNEITTLDVPSNITKVGSYAFYKGKSITSVSLPSSLSFGTNAFSECTNINDINVNVSNIAGNSNLHSYLPSTASWKYYIDGELVTKLVVPSTVTKVGRYAFYNAKDLQEVTLSDKATTIDDYAFSGCTGLTSVTLYPSLTSCGTSAFPSIIGTVNVNISDVSDDSNLHNYLPSSANWKYYIDGELVTKLVVPSTVTKVGSYAFYNGADIKQVDISSSVTSIGDYAFSGVSPTAFICRATTPPTLGSNNTFAGSKRIYVHYSSIDAYKSKWTSLSSSTYDYLPLLDIMFFEKTDAATYAAELKGKAKSTVTSVDFYDGGLDDDLTEEVMKEGMNPNCLYYVPSSANMSGDNIISLEDYKADNVVLTDNYTYDCPIPFHTAKIEYDHNPAVWANGTSGWETITLPFAPTVFKASKKGYISPIMLGSTGNFWLRKYVGSSSDAVYFASTIDGVMEANTPYLVAFPGKSMGNGYLEGQTITFKASDCDIPVTTQPEIQKNGFIFTGNYDATSDGVDGWALNAAGSSFVKSGVVGNQPFTAYFKGDEDDSEVKALRIDFSTYNETTSINDIYCNDMTFNVIGSGSIIINSATSGSVNIYTIDGRLVQNVSLEAGQNRIDDLAKGIYIINNQKILVR